MNLYMYKLDFNDNLCFAGEIEVKKTDKQFIVKNPSLASCRRIIKISEIGKPAYNKVFLEEKDFEKAKQCFIKLYEEEINRLKDKIGFKEETIKKIMESEDK